MNYENAYIDETIITSIKNELRILNFSQKMEMSTKKNALIITCDRKPWITIKTMGNHYFVYYAGCSIPSSEHKDKEELIHFVIRWMNLWVE